MAGAVVTVDEWVRQPPYATRVDLGRCKAPVLSFTPQTGFSKSNAPIGNIAGGNPSFTPTAFGLGLKPSSDYRSNISGEAWAGMEYNQKTSLFVVLIPTVESAAASDCVGFCRSDSSGFIGFQSGDGTNKRWSFVAGAQRTTADIDWVAGAPTCIGFVGSRTVSTSTSCDIYVDGKLAASNSAGFPLGGYTLSQSMTFRGSNAAGCVILGAVAIRRLFSSGEACDATRNPWALFAP